MGHDSCDFFLGTDEQKDSSEHLLSMEKPDGLLKKKVIASTL